MNDLPPDTADALADETARRSQLFLRTLPIFAIPLVVSAITFLLLRLSSQTPILPIQNDHPPPGPLVPVVIMDVFFSSLIILARLKRPTISALLLIGVWTRVTRLGALRSGISSYTPALLIIPICAAGLLIDAVASVSLAALATILVGTLAWLEANGVAVPREPPPFIASNQSYEALGFWIALFATVAALTSVLSGGLQRALRQSRAHATALEALSSQLEARVETQTAQLIEQEREAATLEERARLAREIHDTLAQGLTGIVVQLGAAKRALEVADAPPDADQHIDLAQRMAREALAEARRSVWNLRAPALAGAQSGALAEALRNLTDRPMHPGITTSFEQRGAPWLLPPGDESALLRIGQEALMNVAKHSGATQARILLEYGASSVRLHVCDNGAGFQTTPSQPVAVPGPWGGFGLQGMRERLEALGGTLEIASDGGAQVIATVPRREG